MTDLEIYNKNQAELKAIETLSKSRWWKAFVKVIKDNRKWKVREMMDGLGQSEKVYSRDDLIKAYIKTYNWIIDAPWILIQAITEENKWLDITKTENLEIWDVDELYSDNDA